MNSIDESNLPIPIDLLDHLSISTKRLRESSVKKFYKYFQIPGIVQLAGGLPDYNFFPFETLEASSAQPDRYTHKGTEKLVNKTQKPSENAKTAQVVVPKESHVSDLLREIDVKTALQYGTAQGYPPLRSWVRNFTMKHLHPNIPYKGGPEVVLSCGNTDGMSKVMEALNDVWIEGRDDVSEKGGILCEEFCFTLAKANATPRGMNVVPVAYDSQGMMVDGTGGLEDVLTHWDRSRGRIPHVLYTVTMGHNPTGGVLSVERRKKIYQLCVEYDILIIEDEPYWYLQYPGKECQAPRDPPFAGSKSSGYRFLDSLVPSYLSIDYQGRVIRLDTFSKTIAPGCRLGWITAQPMLIERIERITESRTQQPSGFVQSMVAELLMGRDGQVSSTPSSSSSSSSSSSPSGRSSSQKLQAKAWDVSGFVLWLEGLRNNYQRRMEIMCHTLSEGQYLVKSGRRPSLTQAVAGLRVGAGQEGDGQGRGGSGGRVGEGDGEEEEWSVLERTQMFTFHRPAGGMFLWAEMLWHTHPLSGRVAGARLAAALWELLTRRPYLVLVAPGTTFAATDEVGERKGWRFFRFCFAAVGDDTIRTASENFVRGTRTFWRIKDEREIDKILKGEDEDEDSADGAAADERAEDGEDGQLVNLTWPGC